MRGWRVNNVVGAKNGQHQASVVRYREGEGSNPLLASRNRQKRPGKAGGVAHAFRVQAELQLAANIAQKELYCEDMAAQQVQGSQ